MRQVRTIGNDQLQISPEASTSSNYALAREDQILSECSPQCRHIEDRYSSLVGEWVAGALDARTTAGIVGRTLSSAASAVCLGGDCWILTKAIPFKTARLLVKEPVPARSKCLRRIAHSVDEVDLWRG